MTDRSRIREAREDVLQLIKEETFPYEVHPEWERVTNVRVIDFARLVADPSSIILTDREGLREKIAGVISPYIGAGHLGKQSDIADAVLAVLEEEGTS